MQVGNGSRSDAADRLQAMLDNDSGYGSYAGSAFNPSLMEDSPLASPARMAQGMNSPCRSGGLTRINGILTLSTAESERRAMASHVYQLHYNHNRTALGRAIARTVESLRKLQEVNNEWPAQYPSLQPPAPVHAQPSHDPRPGLHHTQTTAGSNTSPLRNVLKRPSPMRRAETTADAAPAESSSAAAARPVAEPRLVTPQLARDFSVLKLDLKMNGLPQTEIIHSLGKDSKALAKLLDGQIRKSMRHLSLLRERIEDTSSKVLVTGDLNAGKSTFCNALLRRKILPEDEQPCTSIFCEVLDVRENGGLEEVHAIPVNVEYKRDDERTYLVFPLEKLDSIVSDNERFSSCKIYVKDVRSVDESLLNNGVLDIALIDAPGLNNDSLKTTAVFARQEEIDVVVFVVSAQNHFTLSAKEFIYDAAREKAYMFMVVNGYDNIKNTQRCQEGILKQVAHLSPATFKESRDLVHFVSSNVVPVAPLGTGGGGGGSGSGFDPSDDPAGDEDDDSDEPTGKHGESGDKGKGKAKDKQRMRDFEQLEASLRRFVLEKRARSKLAPAKTYLTNVLGDLNQLATFNRDVAQAEFERVTKELEALEPEVEKSKKARNEASDTAERSIEETATIVYDYSRETLNTKIEHVSEQDLGLHYPGVWEAYQYAEDVINAMMDQITGTVNSCENFARDRTGHGVNSIKNLGLLHLGDAYADLTFNPERMLRRKRDALARQVDIDVDMWDFFDLTSLWERQEKVAGTSMAVTVAGVVGGRLLGGSSWIDGAMGVARVAGTKNLGRLIIPGLLAAVALGISYVVASIPQSLPKRLSAKLSSQLAAIDYTHVNAQRISSEVRKALKIPADNLRIGLQMNFEQLQNKREEKNKIRYESETARKYFGNLIRDNNDVKASVDRVDLEGPAPGLAGQYNM